jgi:hypothetical protein
MPGEDDIAGMHEHADTVADDGEVAITTTGVNTTTAETDMVPEGRRPRRARHGNYSDMSTATHLKTVGYDNLVKGVAAIKAVTTAYVHIAFAISEYNRAGHDVVTHTILSQYGLKKGIRLFGEPGAEAVTKELKQLHDRKAIKPMLPSDLTAQQRYRALAYLMCLKLKRAGDLKGRGCADGRSQREYMAKEETSSPTVSTQALILSCMIDAKEERDVATADIPGAFLQTDYVEGDTHLRIEGTMAELLAQIDPKLYRKYIITSPNGKKVLYAETMKAIYGALNSSLLFWIKLSGSLRKLGFITNPYDRCCVNKQIGGKQCTILWHVDNIKVSHVAHETVTTVLALISEEYGKETPLTVTRGKVHDYLGMTIDFSAQGRVKFTMIEYIADALDNLPEDMKGGAATPAAEHLFQVDEEHPTLLGEDDATMFYHNTEKLLFLAKRARPDLQLAVAFLCTRVRAPDTDDYRKLGRLMKYLEATIGLPLILAMDKSGKIRWYIDAAFAVHNYMKATQAP